MEIDANSKPENGGSVPNAITSITMLLVAGMMCHVIAQAGIDTLLKGLMAGGGIGLFMIGSWIMMNNACGNRPFRLTRIDDGHATIGCTIIGVILVLF